MSFLLAVLFPALLMLATFGLSRLEDLVSVGMPEALPVDDDASNGRRWHSRVNP